MFEIFFLPVVLLITDLSLHAFFHFIPAKARSFGIKRLSQESTKTYVGWRSSTIFCKYKYRIKKIYVPGYPDVYTKVLFVTGMNPKVLRYQSFRF